MSALTAYHQQAVFILFTLLIIINELGDRGIRLLELWAPGLMSHGFV